MYAGHRSVVRSSIQHQIQVRNQKRVRLRIGLQNLGANGSCSYSNGILFMVSFVWTSELFRDTCLVFLSTVTVAVQKHSLLIVSESKGCVVNPPLVLSVDTDVAALSDYGD